VSEPSWLDERFALAVHERLLALDGGPEGVRDVGLLRSALARPIDRYRYGGERDLARLAALYTVGIVQNPPFVDGSKRTGFVLGLVFLEQHGLRLGAPQVDAAHAVLAVAAGDADVEVYAAFLRLHARDVGPGTDVPKPAG
jgi:death-on-curing protein